MERPGSTCDPLLAGMREATILAEASTRRVVLWSPSAEALFGYSAAEALDLTLESLVSERGRPRLDDALARCVGLDFSPPLDLPACRKTGEEFTAEVTLSALPDTANSRLLLAVVRDADACRRALDTCRDLDEREQEAQAAAERFAGMLQAATEYSIIATDPAGVITLFNEGAERMLGYRAEDLVGKLTPLAIHDSDEVAARAADLGIAPGFEVFVATARRGGPEAREWTYVRRDGSRLTVSLTVTAMTSSDGGLVGFIGIARDVTEYRQAERALRQATLVVENSPTVLFRWRAAPGWPVEFVSENVRQFGYTAEDLLSGRVSYAAMVHADDLPRVADEVRQYSERGDDRFQQEYRIVSPDGTVRWVDDRTVVERDPHGCITHYQGIVIDITDRKRADEERARLLAAEQVARASAQAAEGRLRFLAEASGALAASLDYENTLQTVAQLAVPAFADACVVDIVGEDGFSRRVAVAHIDPTQAELLRELRRRYPADPDGPHPVVRALRSGQAALYAETSNEWLASFAQDTEHLRLLRALSLTSDLVVPLLARERTLGAISFLLVGSERRYGEADLALAQDLAHRAAIAVDNAWLFRETQQAVRIRNEVLSVVSHDLKNPLTIISGYAQLIQHLTGAAGGNGAANAAVTIEATAKKMTRQLNELLDVARLETGQPLALDFQPMDLVALVRQAVEEQQKTTDRHTMQFETAVPELVGEWDRARLERVLGNLLANAVKYSPEGGRIEAAVAEERVPDGDWAVLTVRDHGLGIPAADLPHVFERFHRASNVAGRIKGTGIGLSSARQIVEQHGGAIEAASEEGSGSTFTVRLPLPRV